MQAERVFVKQHGDFTQRDWERVVWFEATVANVPGLRTARPLWKDTAAGTIGYQHLDGLSPLLQKADEVADKLRIVAARLCALHCAPGGEPRDPRTSLALRDLGLDQVDAAQLEAALPYGLFWGDCWHGNIFVPGPEDVVFIDPLPNRWMFDSRYRWANGAIDLAMLRMSLYVCHPLHAQWRLDARQTDVWADLVTRTYLDACGAPDLAGPVRRLTIALTKRYVAAYRQRLVLPLALLKQALGLRSLARMKLSSEEVTSS